MIAVTESMYVDHRNGKPAAYRYGEPWVAMQLFMEGGFDTPEEAKAAWEKEKMEGINENRNSED